ncbi:uncharacterized protein LOC110988054 [Acanthaster planci]|uniref:Uncharacterized protein LOC110988054 n=1 Tax=Acanthaster planci TaxID=133434 RepID=A0A8B7ZPY6_ACAPL|nr:uncharacterized protein LOC110988054 [Acanthaster planci]
MIPESSSVESTHATSAPATISRPGGSSAQTLEPELAPAKPTVWVIGDGSVCWCAQVAGSSPRGERLNRLAYIHWKGPRRLQMFQFSDFLLEAWSAVPILPDVIILQFGANDLGLVHKHLLSILARQCINLTREVLPHTVIFYSELLPAKLTFTP